MTQERRTRLAPISQETERRFRELNVDFGSGYVSLWNCSVCCTAGNKNIYIWALSKINFQEKNYWISIGEPSDYGSLKRLTIKR